MNRDPTDSVRCPSLVGPELQLGLVDVAADRQSSSAQKNPALG
jgi:hypothetical protein